LEADLFTQPICAIRTLLKD